MRTLILLLIGLFYVQTASAEASFEGSFALNKSAVKEVQRRAKKKKPSKKAPANVSPRKLISEDSLKALSKWLNTEKEYKRIKTLMMNQNSRISLFKERLDKASKVAELYKEPGKDPEYLRDQKEAQSNLAESKKNYDVEAKKLDNLNADLAVAEKRYTIAEKAYKIYNPTLDGFSDKSIEENKVTEDGDEDSEDSEG